METEFKKKLSPLCEPEEMRFIAIDEHRNDYPFSVMCKALEDSKSGYYACRMRPKSKSGTLTKTGEMQNENQNSKTFENGLQIN